MKFIGFDADGVLLDSRIPAWQAASQILGLLGVTTTITSQRDFERHFGAEALTRLVGEGNAGVVRMVHRLAMRQAASSLPLFPETLTVAGHQPMPCIIITAALAQGIRIALGSYTGLFQSITGFEAGRKPALLAAVASRLRVYVTDTVSDVRMCQGLGIPVIAVTWGYDTPKDLAAVEPTVIVRTADQLAAVLTRFHSHNPSKRKEIENGVP